jgi:uncharacterized membrane protein YfcA
MTESFVLLMLLGFGIGTLGTLIGAGGGFILVPILISFILIYHRKVLQQSLWL